MIEKVRGVMKLNKQHTMVYDLEAVRIAYYLYIYA